MIAQDDERCNGGDKMVKCNRMVRKPAVGPAFNGESAMKSPFPGMDPYLEPV
jgi:hypothetical protein